MALILVLAVGVVAYHVGWLTSEVEPGAPAPPAEALSAEEQAYYEYVAPRLRYAAAEARYLADLGEQRSRNILELQEHRNTLTTLLREIARYTEEHAVPERFAEVDAAFREGAAIATLAMRDAVEAFTSFEFARFGEIVPRFREGAERLDLAAQRLEALGGVPVATPDNSLSVPV